MSFEEILEKRMSVRKFKNQKVERDVLHKILDAGRLAPTAKNMQPIHIYVVESDEAIAKLDSVCPCRYGASTCLMICGDVATCWGKGEYFSYEMDASIVATHMMLEATNLGVDSVWVRNFDASEVQEVFDLEENIIPVCMMPLGYRTDDCPDSPNYHKRKSLDDIVEYC